MYPLGVAAREVAAATMRNAPASAVPAYVERAFLNVARIASEDSHGTNMNYGFSSGYFMFRKAAGSPAIEVELSRTGRIILQLHSVDRGQTWEITGSHVADRHDANCVNGVLRYLCMPFAAEHDKLRGGRLVPC